MGEESDDESAQDANIELEEEEVEDAEEDGDEFWV